MRWIGALGGLLMFGFGVTHSFVGWPALVTELRQWNVPAPVISGLTLPWHFTGLAMAVFGWIGVSVSWRRPPGAATTGLVVGSASVAFGIVSAFVVPVVPLLVYSLPGLLIVAGALPRRR